jgi:hypothetical protein
MADKDVYRRVIYGSLLNIEDEKRERGNNTRENIRATLFPLIYFIS